MTAEERDFEEVLSRVLHSETEQVEPVGDGLTKIRARLTEPWLKRQWYLLRNEFMVLGWFVVVRCESLAATVRSVAADATLAARGGKADVGAAAPAGNGERLRRVAAALGGVAAWVSNKGAGGRQRSPGPVISWLRPALAVAGAVVLVVAGVFALGQIREDIVSLSSGAGGITPRTSSLRTGNGVTNGQSGGQMPGVGGPPTSQSSTASTATSQSPGAQASSSPASSPAPSPGGSPPPSPTSSPPSSPTPSPSVTPTPTPTPSSSPSASPGPSASGGPPSAHGVVK